jgi:mannose-6-phosphate isomerase-like protein (cupin superfamily)
MTETATDAQAAHWSEAELASIEARFVMADEGEWSADPNDGFELRSMGLEEASAGLLGAYHLRATSGPSRPGDQRFDFHYLYVLRGSLMLESDDGQTELKERDAIYHGLGFRPTIASATPDTEVVELTAPARGIIREPRPAGTNTPAGPPLLSRDSPNQHVLGAGPRPNVIYRQLGTAEATGGRYRMQINRAAEPAEAMQIWHYHDMAQWFMVLDGWARIEVHDVDSRLLRPGDALTVGAGRRMRHNVADIGEGFQILELCIPADYHTWSAEPPA